LDSFSPPFPMVLGSVPSKSSSMLNIANPKYIKQGVNNHPRNTKSLGTYESNLGRKLRNHVPQGFVYLLVTMFKRRPLTLNPFKEVQQNMRQLVHLCYLWSIHFVIRSHICPCTINFTPQNTVALQKQQQEIWFLGVRPNLSLKAFSLWLVVE
jgi:hypothetical protein